MKSHDFQMVAQFFLFPEPVESCFWGSYILSNSEPFVDSWRVKRVKSWKPVKVFFLISRACWNSGTFISFTTSVDNNRQPRYFAD